ncbi:MAG TPA: hypothetical protein PLP27_12620 [Crocinitomicaceae bacterium]|nr:hypothetical protein [Crocinitomicaceae bacterium]
METKHKERLEEFFNHYPEATECILFADGQIFEKKNESWANRYHEQSGINFQIVAKDSNEISLKITKQGELGTSDELSLKTKAELVEFGKTLGLELNVKDTKDVLLKAIETAQQEDYKPLTDTENE